VDGPESADRGYEGELIQPLAGKIGAVDPKKSIGLFAFAENEMRLQSKTKVTVRDRVIGGPLPLICLPLVAVKTSDVLRQAEELKQFEPDLVEWRIDYYENAEVIDESLIMLKALREKIGNIPLIFTCRAAVEGGFKEIRADIRLELIKAAIESGRIDLIDVEMSNEIDFLNTIKDACEHHGPRLILSYHNFDQTPDEAFIFSKLAQAQEMGADIAKVAVTPKNYKDVLVLLSATLKARMERLTIPIIAISMGPEGGVTRLAGGVFGSDLSFAIGKESSAPGQIPIDALRQAMPVLYG
jgi:3-dehydroquinate dehydratase I